jgi:hypothetical protein
VDFYEHKNYRDYRVEEAEGDEVEMEDSEFDEERGMIDGGDGPERDTEAPRRSDRNRVVSAAYQRSQEYQRDDPRIRNPLPPFAANIAEVNPSLPEPDNLNVPKSVSEALRTPHPAPVGSSDGS